MEFFITMEFFIIVLVLYMAGGIYFMPKFAKEQFKIQKARWSWQSDAVSKSEAVGIAWGKSLIWPVFALMFYTSWQMDTEDRTKARLDQEERELAIVERRLALQQAQVKFQEDHEKTAFLREFNRLDKEARKS